METKKACRLCSQGLVRANSLWKNIIIIITCILLYYQFCAMLEGVSSQFTPWMVQKLTAPTACKQIYILILLKTKKISKYPVQIN